LNFTALTSGTSTLDLLSVSPNVTEVTDTGLNPILTALADGEVILTDAQVTPTPTPTPTSPPGGARVLSVANTLTGVAGTEVEIRVAIDNADNVAGYRVVLGWNAANATYVANSTTSVATLSQGCFAPTVNSATPGSITITSACTNVLSGPGSLIRFRLLIPANAAPGSTIPITFNTAQTRLNDGAIASTTTNGLITIGQPYLWGDVACPTDSIAGTLDVSSILRFDAGLLTSFPCFTPVINAPNFPAGGDVNGDGIMGVLDASLILRFDALLISRFPADVDGDSYGPDSGTPVTKEAGSKSATPVVISALDAAADAGYVDVPVSIDSGADVFGYRLAVTYDVAALGVPSVMFPSELSGWIRSAVQSPAAGTSIFSAAGIDALGSGDHVIAILRFPVQSAAAGSTEVSLDVDATRVNDGEVSATVRSASVQLSTISSVPEWSLF
jgi:hypothetical protein